MRNIDTPEYIKKKDLNKNGYIGVVTNIKDPLFAGRCQVRVFEIMDNLPDDHLPWAVPVNSPIFGSSGAGSLSIPKLGAFVRVNFNNGDRYAPEYSAIQNIDNDLIQEIQDDYEGTHVLLYDVDEELNVIYQRNSGFKIYYKGSYLQISPDAMITLEHANTDSVIQLEGDVCNISTKNEINVSAGSSVSINADEVTAAGNNTTKIGPGPYNHAVLAEVLWPLLKSFATALDNKQPATPGVNVGLLESAKQSATSSNVLISS